MDLDSRTSKAVKNIAASILLKGGSIAISLLLVPLTLSYLNEYEYGIWLTLNSVLSWIYILDIGLGNGLRNKLTEAIVNGNHTLGKIYVSTTFFFMTLIIIAFYLIFFSCQSFLDWYSILNVLPDKVPNLNSLVIITFAFFCISFVLRLIGNIYMAYQLPAINDLLAFIGSAISLIIIFILSKFSDGSLIDVAITFSAVPAIVYLFALPITFMRYPAIAPSWHFVRPRYFHSLISLGMKFMIIQITCLIIFMTSNLLISNLFGPEEVTPYNIAFKYFSVLTFGFNIILTPFWSAITDAYTKGDLLWIRVSMKRIFAVWIIGCIAAFLMILLSKRVYNLWIGDEVVISLSITIGCAIYVCISNVNNIFSYIVNGMGKLHLQLLFSIFQGLIYVPLAIFCGKNFGVTGILIALNLCLALSWIWGPLQCWKLLHGRATGIWNR